MPVGTFTRYKLSISSIGSWAGCSWAGWRREIFILWITRTIKLVLNSSTAPIWYLSIDNDFLYITLGSKRIAKEALWLSIVRALDTGAESPGFKTTCAIFQQTLFSRPTTNGYPASFGAGEEEGGEVMAWYHASPTLLAVHPDSLTAISLTTISWRTYFDIHQLAGVFLCIALY